MVKTDTGYEVYFYNTNTNAYEKMDLGVCKDMKINTSVYVNISEDDIDKYNSSSDYYNDICYTYTSDNGKVHDRYEYYNYSFDEYIF